MNKECYSSSPYRPICYLEPSCSQQRSKDYSRHVRPQRKPLSLAIVDCCILGTCRYIIIADLSRRLNSTFRRTPQLGSSEVPNKSLRRCIVVSKIIMYRFVELTNKISVCLFVILMRSYSVINTTRLSRADERKLFCVSIAYGLADQPTTNEINSTISDKVPCRASLHTARYLRGSTIALQPQTCEACPSTGWCVTMAITTYLRSAN